jgi:DNA-binding transcriptional regulator GbsR (MarR family)
MADENVDGRLNEGEEFEEITSDEVDRVVEQLEKLMETVSSENIKAYLEDAVNNIFFLLYDDEDTADAA